MLLKITNETKLYPEIAYDDPSCRSSPPSSRGNGVVGIMVISVFKK